MVKERFRHRLVRLVALSSHSRGTYVKVRLNQLLLALGSYRETRSVLLRGRLLEIILVKGLVVRGWVLWRVLGAAVVTYLKVIRLQMLDKIGRRLHVLSVGRVNELLLLGCRLLELVVGATYTKIRCKSLVLVLDRRLPLALALLIKEGLLGRAKEGALQVLVAQGHVALLQLVLYILLLFINVRGCEPCVFNCVS